MEQVAVAYRRIIAMPIALLIAWFVLAFLAAILLGVLSAIIRHDSGSLLETYGGWFGPGITASAVAAVILGRRRVLGIADEAGGPTFPRPARSTWAANARAAGAAYVVAGLAALWTVMTIASIVVSGVARLLGVGHVADVGLIGLIALCVPLSIWAYLLGRNHQLAQLESATPPALRRAHRLRDQAQALEDAMHEATLMADDLQQVIDAEKRLIAELLEESTNARRIADIESDQLNALLAHQEQQQRRSTRRERWINIAVAAVSLIAGYLLNLVNPTFLKNLIEH